MFDGATDVSVTKHEFVYTRVLQNGKSQNVNVKLQPVEHAHADGVMAAIDTAMNSTGTPNWKEKLVATGSDGALVNL